ncbi:MAG: AMP-binding protein [Bacillota bacterium]
MPGKMGIPLNWEMLLNEQARQLGDKPFLYLVYQDRYISYREMNDNANRVANFLLKKGYGPGDGLAMLMNNSSQYLDVFFGIQKIGMYVNTVNTSLKGDGLAYIIDNSDTRALVVDYDLIDLYRSVKNSLPKVKEVIVNTLEAPPDYIVPEGMLDLRDAYRNDIPVTRPEMVFDENSILYLMYTSGTTGLPKGVVTRYNKSRIESLKALASFILSPESVYYTALPLFHGNALLITTTLSMINGSTVALSKKFSASRFWDEIRQSKATVFSTLGAMIPILLKQPERPDDHEHNVVKVMSAACPANMWEPFEKRFNVNIWEAYAAIDGTGIIANFGSAPAGSIGIPLGVEIRIVDQEWNDVPQGTTGELLFKVPEDRASKVEYYKNSEASEKKTRGEWEGTGDLVYQDKDGFLYFVGRNTESMRRRGENVSAYEVENAILKHPVVLECAVFGVPSELGEDEIMAVISLVEGSNLNPPDLLEFLQDKLAKFAIPRYVRIVDDFSKTETHRIKKKELQALGVTEDSYDREKQDDTVMAIL